MTTRRRRIVLLFSVLAVGLLAVGIPRTVAAAVDGVDSYSLQDAAEASQPPNQPIVSVPGVFSLFLGQGFSPRGNNLRLESAQVDLPIVNATATVNGLDVNLRDQAYSWESIVLNQSQPAGNQAVTVSGLQATVQGQATNYSTDFSTRVDIHPNEQVQAGATVQVSYDGQARQASVGVADGVAKVAVGPATVAVNGLNVQEGALTVDAAQVLFPTAGVGVRIDGYTLANGQSNWDALTWYGQEFKIGDVVKISDALVVAPGPGSAATTPAGATTHFEITGGDVAQVDGQLVVTYDRATGQPSLSLLDANAQFGSSDWNVAFEGINAGKGGAAVDTVLFTAVPLGMQAQVSGLAVDSANGLSFEQARLLYQPSQPASGQAVGGFELVVDSTEAGYVVSTTTFVPSRQVE